MLKSTFLESDVKILLKDISKSTTPLVQEEREELIKMGAKAYELLALEDSPSQEDIELYEKGLNISAKDTAKAVRTVAEKIYKIKGNSLVLISLARGGIPAGILIKRYLEEKYKVDIPHYALTLIGTKGMDINALKYVLKNHPVSSIQFVDGWTGKGAIIDALGQALVGYDGISSELAVLVDSANLTSLCGTHEDILIGSACLNAATAGLLSRAVYSKELIRDNDFFGAVYYEDFLKKDKTYHFIERIVEELTASEDSFPEPADDILTGLEEVKKIARDFEISNIHFIKPGLGETVRAMIRKVPDIILVKETNNQYIDFILKIAEQKKVHVERYPLMRYNVCSLFKDKNSDVL